MRNRNKGLINLFSSTAICGMILTGLLNPSETATARTSSWDSGTLLSVETKDGETVEKYSDGLTVHISKNGDFSEESTKDGGTMSVQFPDAYGQKGEDQESTDSFISSLIDLSYMHGGQDANSSNLQSRLRQFSTYYLKMKEPKKALPLAEQYLEIQKVLHVEGEPLAFAEKNVGEAKLGSGKASEAISPLQASQSYYETSGNKLLYCITGNALALALLKTHRSEEALHTLHKCQAIATENKLTSIREELSKTIQQAENEADTNTSHIKKL